MAVGRWVGIRRSVVRGGAGSADRGGGDGMRRDLRPPAGSKGDRTGVRGSSLRCDPRLPSGNPLGCEDVRPLRGRGEIWGGDLWGFAPGFASTGIANRQSPIADSQVAGAGLVGSFVRGALCGGGALAAVSIYVKLRRSRCRIVDETVCRKSKRRKTAHSKRFATGRANSGTGWPKVYQFT
jgi:hypothetical protein